MKKLITGVISLLAMLGLSVGGYVSANANVETSLTPLSTSAQATRQSDTATPQPIATATVGYQATAEIAMTSERAAVMTAEGINITIAQITAEANAIELENDRLKVEAMRIAADGTAVSINATGTAAEFIPLTSTVEANRVYLEVARMEQERIYPTLEFAQIQNETYAKFADKVEVGKLILMGAGGVLMLALTAFLITAVIVRAKQPAQEEADELQDLNALDRKQSPPMIFQKVEESDAEYHVERVDTNIPCTLDELLELAEGICRLRKTLAINQWEGSDVHKRMVDNSIRSWMLCNRFSQHVTGSNNEFMVTAKGQQFLLDTLEKGEPPAPYVCKSDSEKGDCNE